MTTTNNLFVRDDLTDVGNIPSGARTYWTSPDIIPVGINPSSDPQSQFGSASAYASWGGSPILSNQQNYIYTRAKNLYSAGAASGEVALYWCKSSLFMNTGLWSSQQIPSVTGPTSPIAASATGAISVASSAFHWLAPSVPSGFHYCLIVRLITDTPSDPNPIPPNFTSSSAYVNWVLGNAQVAYRNVTLVHASAPSRQFAYHFASPDPTDEQFIIAADCYNLPNGTVVSYSCAASGPSPAINESSTVTKPNQSISTVPTTIPGDFEADLIVTVNVPGGAPIPADASVKMRYYRVENSANEKDMEMDAHLMEPHAWGLELDSGMGRVVRLGETVIQYTS